ncbi:hypothetical protein FO519_007646 [Halicephalobus sp. NKZ332]|nr:hypothetical protein FO519_007646 [Halicephalobus sp. NKZ332]
MIRYQLNPCDWCSPNREYRESIDFFDLLVNLFGKPIEPPPNVVYNESSLEDAIENKTVKDVMQAIGYFNKHHKNDKLMIDKIYEQLVVNRELWYARPNPLSKNPKVVQVAEHTPWRYFHDVLRRGDFANHRFVLVSAQTASYYICVKYIINGEKKIEELGICDEHFLFQRCDCNFAKVKVLCSRCNAYVEKKQCANDPIHKFRSENIRCFRLDHGRFLAVGDGEYIDTEVSVHIKEHAKPFDRFEEKRKSSHKRKSPKVSPVQERPPSYQDFEEKRKSPVIRHEKPIQEPYIPDSLKNPYDRDDEYRKPEIIGGRGTPPVVVLRPPAQVIPIQRYEPSFDEPPQPNIPDESHQRHVEGSYSPIPRLPTPENDENEGNRPPPRSRYDFPPIPLRDRPGNLPYIPLQYQPDQRKSPIKTTPIPIYREPPKSPGLRDSQIYNPLPPYDEPRPRYDEVPRSPVHFRPSTPPLPPREPADFNVVIMGPTGVGKSTWINALANYLRYNTLADAKTNQLFDVIPVKFRIQDADWNELFDQIEERHGTRLMLSAEGVYCVDNEAYRYLVVCAQKDEKLEKCMLNFEEYEHSWHKSQHESTRFFDHLHNVKPLETSTVTAYNAIKKVAEELAKLILNSERRIEAYRLAYEVVIDYLIQHSIIITDPLMKEIIRSKRPAPIDLGEKYFVDHRQHRSEVTEEEIYRYLKEFTSIDNIDIEFRKSIEHYVYIYEEITHTKVVRTTEDGHTVKNTESFNEFDLAYGPGETAYTCYEEKRTVITEKVHYFDSRPSSFVGGQSIHSVV